MSHITPMKNTRKQARQATQGSTHKEKVQRSMKAREVSDSRRMARNLKMFSRQGELTEA